MSVAGTEEFTITGGLACLKDFKPLKRALLKKLFWSGRASSMEDHHFI